MGDGEYLRRWAAKPRIVKLTPHTISDTSIVASMDNLVLLAQGTSTAQPAFNANFYVTAATIIPVLYLVLAVQETTDQSGRAEGKTVSIS